MKLKRSQSLLLEQTIFALFIITLFVTLYMFINRAGTQSSVLEQEYSKMIALTIEEAKPGTNITLDLSEIYDKARKNHFDETDLVKIDNKENKVIVKSIRGSGYEFYYFNDVDVLWNLKNDERRIYIEVKEA